MKGAIRVSKTLAYLKRKRKGQGIVEYALLLAFVVGIAMMLNGANLGSAVAGVYDNVANVLFGSEYDLSTPEGRLAADKARIKKLGETIAANFKKNNAKKDDYKKVDNPATLNGDYLSILVLPDGSLNIYTAVDGGKWLSELAQSKPDIYKNYVSALQNAGIDLSNGYVVGDSIKNSKQKDMGTTQYYTDTNFKPYSSGDEGGLNNGYAISFTSKPDNEMKLRYYELNNPYQKEDLGTMYVPRSWLATGEANDKTSDDAKDKYTNKLTKNLDID